MWVGNNSHCTDKKIISKFVIRHYYMDNNSCIYNFFCVRLSQLIRRKICVSILCVTFAIDLTTSGTFDAKLFESNSAYVCTVLPYEFLNRRMGWDAIL